MPFLYFLEGIRNSFLDFFFSAVTVLGEETFFLAFAIIFFWCINKREGYYILVTGLTGTVINQGLKLLCKVPRPWVKDPNFTIVESAREEAVGYSFPSGHTQNAAGTLGAIGRWSRVLWIRVVTVVIILLVGLSRMYLGVHTPQDVIVSLLIAGVLVFALHPLFVNEERFHKAMPYLIAVSVLLSLAFLIYVNVISEVGLDPHNLESGRKNGATLFGCFLGLLLVYPLDRCCIKFRTDGRWYSQVIKLVLGLAVVIALKEGLRSPLEWLVGVFSDTPEYIARGIRYFIIVMFAGAVWPLTFGFFSRLRISFMERFTDCVKNLFVKKSHAPGDAE